MTPQPTSTQTPVETRAAVSDVDAPEPAQPNDSGEAVVPLWLETITLPRWVVYAQAGLLGLVGVAFFLFGIIVGHLSTDRNAEVNATFDCQVAGSVAFRLDGDLRADEGAVVFLLPVAKTPDKRAEGRLVNPDTFKEVDNIAIDRINELGGAVVRANGNGQFNVIVDANYGNGIEYYLLAVSKHKRGVDTEQMTKEQYAMISTFFAPVEDVIEDRSYVWLKLTATEERLDLPEIEL
ncbi:MAG: hypothetical protein AAFN77_21830 [Planctomycetota bacterium]